MKLEFEKLSSDDIVSASMLVNSVFLDSIAPTLTQQGIQTFQSAMTAEAMLKRLQIENRFLVCKQAGSIVGLGEVRDINHLNLLFVLPAMQRKGIGRQLFNRLIRDIPDNMITVNASLNSVSAYKTLGFEITSEIKEVRGIRSQAMIYDRSR